MKAILILLLTLFSSIYCASIPRVKTEISGSFEDSERLRTHIVENLLQEEDKLLSSDSERDILSIIFRENVLVHAETDFLIRLYDVEMRCNEILPGRKRDILNALINKIQTSDFDSITKALFYAYTNNFEYAMTMIIKTISDNFESILKYIVDSENFSEDFIEYVQCFKAKLSLDTDYVLINYADLIEAPRPFISMYDFKHIKAENRLPAAIRHITDISVSDDQVTSSFIKKNVIDRFDLETILILHEIEMMDNLHIHDTEGVIENHLNCKIYFERNDNMAKLALQMYVQGYFAALKLIIDKKFSFKSPFSSPLWFQDLIWLFNYAAENNFPEEFYPKVLSLAKPSAVRRYVSKSGIQQVSNISAIEINDINFNDEDLENIYFN